MHAFDNLSFNKSGEGERHSSSCAAGQVASGDSIAKTVVAERSSRWSLQE